MTNLIRATIYAVVFVSASWAALFLAMLP